MPGSREPLFEVQVDIYIARRKRMHSVFDNKGLPVFHGPHILQVLGWLSEQDIKQALFTDEDTTYLVKFERRSTNQQTPGDQTNG